ncbi:MAG: prolipoprotein diacylglyceryl transferase [Deltaproteobacteria bacterium]|nr:prolipoprotein diacylglyceryl transferase [Deltaproteobacteria bacterium]
MHPLIPYFEQPVIQLGPLPIHAFGILVAIGFVTGGHVAQQKATQFGGSADAINRLIGWLVFGVFVGGHWGHILMYEPGKLAGEPELFGKFFQALSEFRRPTNAEIPALLQFWHGLSSYGGFAMCVGLTIWFFRREKLPFWPHADALAIGLSLGWFFGRMGCFSAHDHAGNPTNFWLGVYGMCPGNNPTVACHDLGLYEAIWSISVFGLFTWLDKKPRPQGFFVGWLATLYGPARFVSDFFRNREGDARYFGLTPAQYGSIIVTLVGLWILRSRLETKARPHAA